MRLPVRYWFGVMAVFLASLALASCSGAAQPEATSLPSTDTPASQEPARLAEEQGDVYPSTQGYPSVDAYPGAGVYPYPAAEYTGPYPYPYPAPYQDDVYNPYPAPGSGSESVVEEAQPTPTVRLELIATNPDSVEIASGNVQLIEFFAFW